MNNKIKIIGGILLGIGLIIACFCINPSEKQDTLLEDAEEIFAHAEEQSASITENEQKDFIESTVSDYLEKYQQSEPSIFLISKTGCAYCQIAEPILKKIAKEYDLEIYDLNTATFSQEDKEQFIASNEIFQDSFFGTPFLMIIKDNKIVDSENGLTDYEHYVKFFQDNKIIITGGE